MKSSTFFNVLTSNAEQSCKGRKCNKTEDTLHNYFRELLKLTTVLEIFTTDIGHIFLSDSGIHTIQAWKQPSAETDAVPALAYQCSKTT